MRAGGSQNDRINVFHPLKSKTEQQGLLTVGDSLRDVKIEFHTFADKLQEIFDTQCATATRIAQGHRCPPLR